MSKKQHKNMDHTSASMAKFLDARRERNMKKREAWDRTGLGLNSYQERGGRRR